MKEKQKELNKQKNKKVNYKKIVIAAISLIIIGYLVYTIYLLIKEPTNVFKV